MRRAYNKGQLTREMLDANPFAQFKQWLDDALAADLLEANAMSLATATANGETSIRTVLLRRFSEDGFVFFTNLESTKARQIAENPHVSLLFFWRELERQVKVNGTATKLPAADVARYFLSRPRESQAAAWASPQSRVIEARRALEMKFHEVLHRFAEGQIPVPSFWGGFIVEPRTIEFWQGGEHRLHDRFEYRRGEDGWSIVQLAP